jgi:hypothetical protein
MLEGESQRRLGCLDYKRFDIDARGRHGPAGNASYDYAAITRFPSDCGQRGAFGVG